MKTIWIEALYEAVFTSDLVGLDYLPRDMATARLDASNLQAGGLQRPYPFRPSSVRIVTEPHGDLPDQAPVRF